MPIKDNAMVTAKRASPSLSFMNAFSITSLVVTSKKRLRGYAINAIYSPITAKMSANSHARITVFGSPHPFSKKYR